MAFSSLIFIFAFLSSLLVVYFIVPEKFKMTVLFVYSMVFYGWVEPKFVVIMAISMVSAYIFGYPIAKYRDSNRKKAKIYMIISICINLGFLLFFKYFNFFTDNLARIPIFSGLEDVVRVALPIGISFYTFQIMSYSIDIYRGDANLQKNFISFGTYVVLFPQLVAGPIVRYKDIDNQLRHREENIDKFSDGVKRFTAGLGKKILLADSMDNVVTHFEAVLNTSPTTLSAWILVIAYTFQIYFDFSGYSDMAIGLGKMFGFEFAENFNYPYISASITEFWRRWHISLSTWFKEYIYIPLGGNRKGLAKQFRNIAVVWLLTGFWHGASWNFVIWGAYFGVLLIFEKLFLLKALAKIPKLFGHIYSLILILFGWLIFYFVDLSDGITCLKAMFGVGVSSGATATDLYDLVRLIPVFAVSVIASTPYPKKLFGLLERKSKAFAWAEPVLTALLLAVCVSYMVSSSYSPFLYNRF